MPNIKEISNNLNLYTGDERVVLLNELTRNLTRFSIGQLKKFQNEWRANNSNQEFDAYVAAQNDVIQECLQLECSEFGAGIREALGLQPLTWDTSIELK
jgi:hypothetical protein